MKTQDISRASRVRTFAIYTASIASIAAAVAATSLLISGCVPCTDPNGCSTTTKPMVAVTLTPGAGTYAGQQVVSISAPNAQKIFFSTDGATPTEATCSEWDGNPIPVNDWTQLRVLATGDTVNYRSRSIKAEYKITSSAYANRTALNNWLALEKDALNAVYCSLDPTCTPPNPIDFLTVDQHVISVCPDGGVVSVDVLAYSMASFTYTGCAGAGIVADGTINLIPDFSTGKITGSGNVAVSGSGYSATVADGTIRTYSVTGSESARAGRYDVSCSGASCASQSVGYNYGTKGTLWIDDPAVPNSCAP